MMPFFGDLAGGWRRSPLMQFVSQASEEYLSRHTHRSSSPISADHTGFSKKLCGQAAFGGFFHFKQSVCFRVWAFSQHR
jgi:hypothetical protein